MPPKKKRAVTVPSSSDGDVKSAGKRKTSPRAKDTPGASLAKMPKRKARKRADDDDDDDELPPMEKPAKKPKHRSHEPANAAELGEFYLTQMPQEMSSPWKIRGPIYQKQKQKPPVCRNSPPRATEQAAPTRVLAHHSPRSPSEDTVSPSPPRNAANRAPFYSSPFSPPKETANPAVFHSSPPKSPTRSDDEPSSSAVDDPSPDLPGPEAERDVLHDPPPKPFQDIELDPADFSTSPPTSPRAPAHVADISGDDIQDDIVFTSLSPVMPDKHAGNPTGNVPSLSNGAAYDIEKELADLPSDAFASSSLSASSSPRKSPDKNQEPIYVSSQGNHAPPRSQRLAAPVNGLRQTTLFGGAGVAVPASQANKRHNWPLANKDEPRTHHKLDLEAMKTWVYPTNLGMIRDYQFNIVHRGLFHNLLVALPTGLGKTFIAATIMLNFFRWTTEAQIVFVAPTRPLVSQQIEACFGIAGIPRSQTTMLTGGISPALRAEEWKSKRVFFMTPQTLVNDLTSGVCDSKNIVLLVVDEAHRATGGYAYVEVVKFIRRYNPSFRVLALTATPGANVDTVQKVIDGLEISRVEIRTENSLDIKQFVHSRKVEKKVLRNNKDLLVCMDLLSRAMQPVMDKLNQQNAFWSRDPMQISLYGLNQSRERWSKSDAGRNAPGSLKGMVNSIFQALIGLARGIDVLKYHGIRPFYNILRAYKNEATAKWKKEICDSPHFKKLMDTLGDWTAKPDYMGHPKLECLRKHILNHFLDAGEGGGPQVGAASNTKVMVFAHWRDSAEDIARVLKLNEPMIRPHVFVGQAATKTSEAMDQKRQLEVVKQFKEGVYNTLVATSIGEEGLDIGEVDLIVCYDQKASPIRMLQRMGRTGRKRQGNILLLQMEGKEENDALAAKDAYDKMQEKISNGDEFNFHTELARRIVPKDINPVVDKRRVEIPLENSQPDLPEPKKRGKAPKRPPKKFQMPDGVRTGFVTASRMNGDDTDDDRLRPKGKSENAAVADEPEIRAALGEVVLSKQDEMKLQRQYQNIHDADDDNVVKVPSLALYPARQRRKSSMRYIGTHSRTTLRFVDMVNRMHNMDRGCLDELRNNLHMSDLEAGPSVDEVSDIDTSEEDEEPRQKTPARSRYRVSDEVGEAPSSSPPPTDPRMRIQSQGIALGTQDTEGEDEFEDEQLDSELAAFVADDDERIEMVSSSLPSIRPGRSKPFYIPQAHQVDSDDDDDDDDLPDINTLVRKKGGRGQSSRKELGIGDGEDEEDEDDEPVVRQVKRRRRLVDDSDSE